MINHYWQQEGVADFSDCYLPAVPDRRSQENVMTKSMLELWEAAALIDSTLKAHRPHLAELRSKQVHPVSYSRDRLFSQMVRGRVSLFNHFPVYFKEDTGPDLRRTLLLSIQAGFPASQKARVQTGPSRTIRRLKVPEAMRRWEAGRALVGVTDLHVRGTRFAEMIDGSALSDFDILCSDQELIEQIEMLSLVISSKGTFTDSHTDDCDGSNHCFVGKKLWLAWDRIEGRARGLQDVDRDEVSEQAKFDIKTFVFMPSACWFVVKANETLFLPGNLSHKVITLEPYIGIGGFHVTLPGYLRNLKRWILYDTLDVQPKSLLEKINQAILEKLDELHKGSRGLQAHWGLGYLQKAVHDWEVNERPATKRSLMRHPTFATFIEVAGDRRGGVMSASGR
jgi:hypothetical protein